MHFCEIVRGLGTAAISAALCASLPGMPAAAQAQGYPSRPITLIITGTPGGPPDIVGRWIADKLAPVLGQPIIVMNRPGAGGNLAMRAAAASAPDGYTLVVAGQGPFALNPHMYDNAGYDPLSDFAPITQIEDGPLILAAHRSVPANSLSELIALARQKPGVLNYGSPGTGTPPHMASELFLQKAQINVTRVPYPGPPAAMIDLVAGRLTYAFGAINIQMPQIAAATIKPIAVTSLRRVAMAPNIPTLAESGLPGFDYSGWLGIAAPKGTPRDIIVRLQTDIAEVLKTPEARSHFAAQGREIAGSSPDEFTAYIAAEYAKWGPVIRAAGIKAE
jgi:tripartite-type tricarboxylate transporter receptor subunit TctC